MDRTVIAAIASKIDARLRCIVDCEKPNGEHFREWIERHKDSADEICEHFMPSGSGIDSGTKIDWNASRPERIVFTAPYHHMDSGGSYDGWTEHDIIVTPSLVFGTRIRITGRNRNDIKEYLHGCFDYALGQSLTYEMERTLFHPELLKA